ncbi:hypothetical protein [Paucimonas lemoignei]|uniref:hypothetical protein n=1 Tax=Paucimonas lemoignei TaxID=29443 RepID=UPI0010442114|nr:hypothetical protein [Paucimonas lemoignei]
MPLTLVGAVLIMLPTLLLRGRIDVVTQPTPALLVRGRLADLLLEYHPFGAMCAMAIGHIVIAQRQGLTARILTHELAHVRQAAHWGFVFPVVYIAASVWALLHGKDAYWSNHFEIAARRAEQES